MNNEALGGSNWVVSANNISLHSNVGIIVPFDQICMLRVNLLF